MVGCSLLLSSSLKHTQTMAVVEYAVWTKTNYSTLEASLLSAITGGELGKGEQGKDWEVFDPSENPDSEPEKTALLMGKVMGVHMMEIKRMDGEMVKSVFKFRRTPPTEGELNMNTDSLFRIIGEKIHKQFGDDFEEDTVIHFTDLKNYRVTFSSKDSKISSVQTEYKQTVSEYVPKSKESPNLISFGIVGPTDIELSNNFKMSVTTALTPDPFIVKIMESIKGIRELRYTKFYSVSGKKYSTGRIERTPATDGDLLKDNGSNKLKEVSIQIKEHLNTSYSRVNFIRTIDFIDNNGVLVRVFRCGE